MKNIIKKIKTIEELTSSMDGVDINTNNAKILELAIETEKLYLLTRELLIENCCFNEFLVFEKVESDIMGIDVYEKNDCFFIKLPLLLPFKKLKRYRVQLAPITPKNFLQFEHCNAILASLEYSLNEYLKNNSIDRKKYSKATYEITHIFGDDFPKAQIPDNDNYELKQIIDLIISYISIKDDGYENVQFFYKTEIKNSNYTLIKIIPKGDDINDCKY